MTPGLRTAVFRCFLLNRLAPLQVTRMGLFPLARHRQAVQIFTTRRYFGKQPRHTRTAFSAHTSSTVIGEWRPDRPVSCGEWNILRCWYTERTVNYAVPHDGLIFRKLVVKWWRLIIPLDLNRKLQYNHGVVRKVTQTQTQLVVKKLKFCSEFSGYMVK